MFLTSVIKSVNSQCNIRMNEKCLPLNCSCQLWWVTHQRLTDWINEWLDWAPPHVHTQTLTRKYACINTQMGLDCQQSCLAWVYWSPSTWEWKKRTAKQKKEKYVHRWARMTQETGSLIWMTWSFVIVCLSCIRSSIFTAPGCGDKQC